MSPMNRCSYFETTQETLSVVGICDPLRVPCYGCRLVQALLARLKTTPEGRSLVPGFEASSPLHGETHPAFGPDLVPIHFQTCSSDRCRTNCQPSFTSLLEDFDLDTAIPTETPTERARRIALENLDLSYNP